MDITIKRLSPELIGDYLHFFDITPHSERAGDEDSRCYCVWWCGDVQDKALFEARLATKHKRRDYARDKIKAGQLTGYLAYDGDRVIGWCNANRKADCYDCFCWQNFMKEVRREPDAVEIKSIYCFTVSPEYRGQGVASRLLRRVCEDAEAEGYMAVEAYPNKSFIDTAQDFMGPRALYDRQGFVTEYETKDKLVMRKML